MGMSFEFEGLADAFPAADEAGIEMLEAAGPVLVEEVKRNVQQVVAHSGESELVKSVTMSRAKKGRYGKYIVSAYFEGFSSTKTYRHSKTHRGRYEVSNALKAVWKEYGIPSRGIPAQPFIERSTKNAEDEALRKMQEVFDRRVGE